jgi:formamidopyrimidine-DNA glycosylase
MVLLMPELPEVETVRRYLESTVLDRKVERARVLDTSIIEGFRPEQVERAMARATLVGIKRHGKQLFLETDRETVLTIHLGMTGELEILSPPYRPGRHDRLTLRFSDGMMLVYRDQRKFGSISLAGSMRCFVQARRLGPDALSVSGKEFAERVNRHRRAVKTVLLDQHVIAGVGNLYADEILFQARLHPMARADRLTDYQLRSARAIMTRVLRRSIAVRTDFDRLPSDYLLAHRFGDELCPTCEGPLRVIKVGGRTTYFCPKCQQTTD